MHDASTRLSRRAFAQGSAALALVAGLPVLAATRASTPRLVLCDRRHAEHLTTEDRAAPVVVFEGDLTRVWVERVQPLWREGGAVIEGIASPAALFCLEQLARGERHRLVARAALSNGSTAVRFRFAPIGPGAHA